MPKLTALAEVSASRASPRQAARRRPRRRCGCGCPAPSRKAERMVVAGHVGKHAQLDLRIVRVHQHQPGRATKAARIFAAHRAHGDVCRFGSLEEMRPVAVAVWSKEEWTRPFSSRNLISAPNAGAVQLLVAAAIEDQRADGVILGEGFQHLGAGGGVKPRLVLRGRGRPRFVKQHLGKLLGRFYVERLPPARRSAPPARRRGRGNRGPAPRARPRR